MSKRWTRKDQKLLENATRLVDDGDDKGAPKVLNDLRDRRNRADAFPGQEAKSDGDAISGMVRLADLELGSGLLKMFGETVIENFDPQTLWEKITTSAGVEEATAAAKIVITYVIRTGAYTAGESRLKRIPTKDARALMEALKTLGINSSGGGSRNKWRVTVPRLVTIFAIQISGLIMKSPNLAIRTVYDNPSGIPSCYRFSGASGLIPKGYNLLIAAFQLHSYRTSMIVANQEMSRTEKKAKAKDGMKNVMYGVTSSFYSEGTRKKHYENAIATADDMTTLELLVTGAEGQGGRKIGGWNISPSVIELVGDIEDADKQALTLMKKCFDHAEKNSAGSGVGEQGVREELSGF